MKWIGAADRVGVVMMAGCLVLGVVAGAAEAADTSYVLNAAKWTAKQDRAVREAGGVVVWSHAKTGLAAVTSDNPAFLDEVMATRAFQGGSEDEVVQWQDPIFAEEVITPGDETFFGFQWNMQAIEAPGAWDAGCDGLGARVAIIDGGIYDIHADLASNLDAACSASFVEGEPWNTDLGTFWHATHVAGIVAGADNGFGVIGVAPNATLMGVKVLHGGSGGWGAILAGILFASDPSSFEGFEACQKADIINMSLGATFNKRLYPGFIGYVTKAVNFAASQGVLLIASAGNLGLDLGQLQDVVHIPADAGTALSISATGPVGFIFGDTDFRRPASYSNYGEGSVFVAAPGGDDTLYPGPGWFYDMVLSSCRGTSTPPTYSFCFADGTSMAAPAAAGVAALIKGANPYISLGALKAKLKNTADDEGKVGHDEFYGHGFVNARRACTE